MSPPHGRLVYWLRSWVSPQPKRTRCGVANRFCKQSRHRYLLLPALSLRPSRGRDRRRPIDEEALRLNSNTKSLTSQRYACSERDDGGDWAVVIADAVFASMKPFLHRTCSARRARILNLGTGSVPCRNRKSAEPYPSASHIVFLLLGVCGSRCAPPEGIL